MTVRSLDERTLVTVRLIDIDIEIRRRVADDLIKRGEDGFAMSLAWFNPNPAVTLDVPAWKATLVLGERKRPPGATPYFE